MSFFCVQPHALLQQQRKNNFCCNDIVFKGILNMQKRKEVTKRQERKVSIEIDRQITRQWDRERNVKKMRKSGERAREGGKEKSDCRRLLLILL